MINQNSSYSLWISHSGIRDFLECPRAYFLRHVYRDPKTSKRINIINPPLALGNTVHEVLDEISVLPADKRFENSLLDRYEKAWTSVAGNFGGFKNEMEEEEYKTRGQKMLKRVMENPGPLLYKAVKLISIDEFPPRYLFSAEENITLCGKVDWLEYEPEDDSVHIIDFKTGTKEEDADSLQLSIYALLVKNCQKRNVHKISYWYLDRQDAPQEMPFPDFADAQKQIMNVGMQIKYARQNKLFSCPRNGCFTCRDLELIVQGKAEFIKTSGYQDIYRITA